MARRYPVKRFSRKKRNYRWKGKKRTYRKKRQSTKVYKQIRNGFSVPGMSAVKVVTMPYSSVVELTPSIAGTAQYVFKANDIYDPDFTSVLNHQPYSHDTYATIYNKYCVIGSKITVKFRSLGAAITRSTICGVVLDENNASLPTTLSTKMERYKGCYKTVEGQDIRSKAIVNAFYSAKKFFALKNVTDSDDQTVSFHQSPVRSAYYNVFCQCLDSTTSPGTLQADIRIEYIVRMSEPKDILGS